MSLAIALRRQVGGSLPSLTRSALPVAARLQVRLLSTGHLQRHRLSPPAQTLQRCRSFWWSSSTSSTPQIPTPASDPPVTEVISPPPLQTDPVQAEVAVDASTATEEAAGSLDVETTAVSEPPSSSEAGVFDDLSVAVPDIPPLQYGDLASQGLAHWYTPAGIIQQAFELVQVSTGLPPYACIIIVTVLTRVLLFPLSVKSIRAAARLMPYKARMEALKEETTRAQRTRDQLAMQRSLLTQRKIYSDAGVRMRDMIALPIVQLPVALGTFFGVKHMCELPVVQLTRSGLEWLPNLTVPDTTYALPILSAFAVNFQILASAPDMNAAGNPAMPHLMNLFRVVSFMFIPFMSWLQSGVFLYVISSVLCVTAQTLILRIPAVRRKLGIPIVPRMPLPSLVESVEYAKAWFRKQAAEARAAQAAQGRLPPRRR